MPRLSISQAWSETGAFLAREARLILPIALLLLAIPAIAGQLLLPAPAPGGAVTPAMGAFGLLISLLVLVCSVVGGLAITHLALRPGAAVGEALQLGFRRFLPLVAAWFLLMLPVVLIAFILIGAFVGDAIMKQPADPANLPPELQTIVLILTIVIMALYVKLLPMTPVAAEEKIGPVAIIRRSWSLTRGHYLKLLGMFIALVLVGAIVIGAINFAVAAVTLILAGPIEPGRASFAIVAAVQVLLQTIVGTILLVLFARIYAQLAGDAPPPAKLAH